MYYFMKNLSVYLNLVESVFFTESLISFFFSFMKNKLLSLQRYVRYMCVSVFGQIYPVKWISNIFKMFKLSHNYDNY